MSRRVDVVSFDAAGTLVRVDWRPERLAVQAARGAGLLVADAQVAAEAYGRMLRSRWGHFQELNLTRSEAVCEAFWFELGRDWLERIGEDPGAVEAVCAVAEELLYGPGSEVFGLYEDTLPGLEAVRGAGMRMMVVSNWDVSLHKTMRVLGLTDWFEVVVASLEEGVEKPEARLFEIACGRMGVDGGSVLHVGDDALADVAGARGAGMRGILIDRSGTESEGVVTDLRQVVARL